MAFEVNFVNNVGSEGLAHWQMLLKIKTFAEANGWVTLRYLAPTDGSPRELIMRGPGLSGADQIFVGFRTYHDVSADYYNLTAAGMTGYVASNDFASQPDCKESGIPAHNQRIDYWLIVTGRRINFGLKVGTPVYEHGGAGFYLPYANPGQYPYPMFVAGMLDGIPPTRFSNVTHSMPYKGDRPNMRIRFVDGSWRAPVAFPWNVPDITGDDTALRDTNGTYMLFPVTLMDETNVFGELEGVFHISGFNNVVENTITLAGKAYVVMQDVSRNGFADYYALELS
jgi:hypothetical protein